MKTPQLGSNWHFFSSIMNSLSPLLRASITHLNCMEHTDNTSGTRRLNSSKHPQEPEAAKPLKISPIPL